MSTSHLH